MVPLDLITAGSGILSNRHVEAICTAEKSASGIFLGWAKSKKDRRDFYVRQLGDMKISVTIEDATLGYVWTYGRSCGRP